MGFKATLYTALLCSLLLLATGSTVDKGAPIHCDWVDCPKSSPEHPPVCGYDGNGFHTFGNDCLLIYAVGCRGEYANFVKAYDGECDVEHNFVEKPQEQDSPLCARVACSTEASELVCASNGWQQKTFHSQCLLDYAVFCHKEFKDYVKESNGPCDGSNKYLYEDYLAPPTQKLKDYVCQNLVCSKQTKMVCSDKSIESSGRRTFLTFLNDCRLFWKTLCEPQLYGGYRRLYSGFCNHYVVNGEIIRKSK